MEDLPVHVTVDILSRLPVKTIIRCKCVCKKWLDLVSDSYFANLHLSRSPASLMIHHIQKNGLTRYHRPGILKWLEFEDKLSHHNLHHDPIMSLDLNLAPIFQKSRILPVGEVNGLLCLWQFGPESDNLYICNPITREYMILPRQQYYQPTILSTRLVVYCFGVSSLTKEYKVIRIFQGDKPLSSISPSQPSLLEAEVYTLGTGQWRSLGHVPFWLKGISVAFLNGHAHWTIVNHNSPEKILAFDFDKETFDLFPSPPSETIHDSLGVLNGCLCLCDTYKSHINVWVMKEYGIKKSWHKEFVIERRSISPHLDLSTMNTVYIIEGLKDGTLLMSYGEDALFIYCPWRKSIVDMETFDGYFTGVAYRPSFHRVHNFENETVHVF